MKKYLALEKHILDCFPLNQTFVWNQKEYKVIKKGKPRPQNHKGECKTDIYLLLSSENERKEIKLSVKMKSAAEWQESKLTQERAFHLWGEEWSKEVAKASLQLKKEFNTTPLIFKNKKGNTEKGSVTMGWRLEITHKPRRLSVPLEGSKERILNTLYKGTNLCLEKRNAKVGAEVVPSSGVADYYIETTMEEIHHYKDVLERMQEIDKMDMPLLHLAFIANNYRTIKQKIDGSRPLAVSVKWKKEKNRLIHTLEFNEPLEHRGRNLANDLKELLKEYQVKDITQVEDIHLNDDIVYA